MKSNILLVGLDYEFVKNIANELADAFDMFFLDVNGLIEYRLIDPKNVQKICGVDYFEQEQQKVAQSVRHYENSVISFPYSLFIKDGMADKVSTNAIVVFISLNKKMLNLLNKNKNEQNNLEIELLTYTEFNKLLAKKADIVVKPQKLDKTECINLILDQLKQTLLQ